MEQSIDILLLFVRALGCFGTFALLGWRACSLAVSVSLSLGLTAFMVPLLLVGARGESASILADVVLRPTLLLDAPPSLIAGNLVVGIIAGAVGSAAVAVFLFLSGWIQELVFPALRSSSERPLSPALGTLFVLFPLALLFEAGGGASLLGAVAEALRAAPPRSPWGLLSTSSVLTGAGASALKVAAL
ncbi:MAG: hypothetical protein IT290_10320, partial [Deltaproteobacteria bacterium]|nr:hypothetical protein [Deltaproteobacteria bacterium]